MSDAVGGSDTGSVWGILVTADSNCFIEIAAAPTATTTASMYVPANVNPIFLKINNGEKVAGIVSASTGYLYVTELSR
jgi:hypothetical protein